MEKSRKNAKGFSLIELLATIFIISIIFGIGSYFMLNTINNSKEKSQNIAYNNIKTTARIYVKENPNEILWQQNQDNTNQSYSCISIKVLINKGLLKNDVIEKNNPTNYVMVTKDNNENILSETLDTTGICLNNTNIVENPTSDKYCNNQLEYSGEEQILTNNTTNEKFQFLNNSGKNAGNYEVTAKLVDGYIWEDGTLTDKKITCNIKKATPLLTLNPSGSDTSSIEVGKNMTTTLTSTVDGKISIKPANKDYITANTTDNSKNITTNTPKEITISPLATRNIETTITITVTPTDTKNYYNSSIVYTIGKPQKTKVPIPTANTYCKTNLFYNQTTQILVNNAPTGYRFLNTTATNIGEYTIIARLQYGYIWEDNSSEDKTITCEIKRPTPLVTYNNQNGSGCTNKTVTYESTYGNLCLPSRNGYTFTGWFTQASNGNQITDNTPVTNFNNHTIYAHWQANKYILTFDGNGGIPSMNNKEITYNNSYGSLATASRSGYSFIGWFTSPSGGTQITTSTIVTTTSNQTVYAHWQATNTYKIAITTDIWNIYKNPGYVFNVGFTKITYYPNSPTAATETINQGTTRYNNTVASEYVGTIAQNRTVYVEVDANNYPTSYVQLSNKNRPFIKIYVSASNITKNPYGCGLNSLPIKNINGANYYEVWIAAYCKNNGVTCGRDQVSIVFQ